MNIYHLTYGSEEWKLVRENSKNPLFSFDTQEAALKHAVQYMTANKGSLKIYDANGMLSEERAYPGV